MLVLSRKLEQSLNLGDDITITVLGIDGDRVKLGIEAPRSVTVLRQEIYQQVRNRPRYLVQAVLEKNTSDSWQPERSSSATAT